MDAVRLEQQVASVERGITFLKQEHLAMLTGLQLEITHLKRRCHGEQTEDPAALCPIVSLNHSTALFYFFPLVFSSTELSCELDSRFPDRSTTGKKI